jgi:hypothetical protein
VTSRRRDSSISIVERRVIMHETTVVIKKNIPSNKYV